MRGFTAVSAENVRITARGPVREAAERVLGRLWIDEVPVRLASEDPTLWSREAGHDTGHDTGPGEAAPHACWPAQPGPARALLGEIGALVERARGTGLTEIVLLGSGPQARAAEMLARNGLRDRTAAASRARRAPLTVLDGRDPGPLLRVSLDGDRLLRTIVVVTGEDAGTDALRRILAQAMRDAGLSRAETAERFVFLAEPGSALAARAEKSGHLVLNGVGGQVFGALSPAALVPAALAGVDVAELLDLAASVLPSLTRPENNPGLVLGAVLGGCARAGRDKIILGDFPERPAGLGAWVASLLAGATQGRLLPVVQPGGLLLAPADDLFQLTLDGRPHQDDATVSGPLIAQVVVWEYAAAVTAYLLAADPFAALPRTAWRTDRAGIDVTGPGGAGETGPGATVPIQTGTEHMDTGQPEPDQPEPDQTEPDQIDPDQTDTDLPNPDPAATDQDGSGETGAVEAGPVPPGTAPAHDQVFDEPETAPPPAFTMGHGPDVIEVHGDGRLLTGVVGLRGVLDRLVASIPPDGHLTVMAHLDHDAGQGQGAGVRRLAALLADRGARPVTVEWSPARPLFLHDGMEKGVFLILTGNVMHDAAVPDKRYRLSGLQLADALGDARALSERGRPVVRLHLHDRSTGIAHLLEAARGEA